MPVRASVGGNSGHRSESDGFRVHALCNVAVFDTETRIPAEKISYALNQRLPEDIRIQSSCEVPLNWHPRKQNAKKTYEYKILNRKIDMPVGASMRIFAIFP